MGIAGVGNVAGSTGLFGREEVDEATEADRETDRGSDNGRENVDCGIDAADGDRERRSGERDGGLGEQDGESGLCEDLLTSLIVFIACLYACISARPPPETNWMADKTITIMVWKEKDEEWFGWSALGC